MPLRDHSMMKRGYRLQDLQKQKTEAEKDVEKKSGQIFLKIASLLPLSCKVFSITKYSLACYRKIMKQIRASHIPEKGAPFPLGATRLQRGWNFAVHAQADLASCVIAPFSNPTDQRVYLLDPEMQKTGTIWHLFIPSHETA